MITMLSGVMIVGVKMNNEPTSKELETV